jgi:hypothetical protein
MWQLHPDYVDFVNQTWDPRGSGGLSSLPTSLEKLQVELSSWDRDVFGSVRKKLHHLRKELESERSHTLYRGPTDRERYLMKELVEVLAREEEMERQRSRVEWLKSGNRNTGFFQAREKARSRPNRIRALKRADGTEDTTQEGIKLMAKEFYQNLFTAQEVLQPELICQYVPKKITAAMAEMLCQNFTATDVETTLFQMGPSKAPGADGFTAGVFQKHWLLLKDKVLSAVLGFPNGGDMPEVINHTVLVLIPKVANPSEMS